MPQRSLIAAPLLLAAALAAGCGSPADSPPTPTLFVIPTSAPTPSGAAALPAPAQESAPASQDEAATTEPTTVAAEPPAAVLLPGQRSAPLGVDQGFHNDPASLVAATGRPQMIEFFTFW